MGSDEGFSLDYISGLELLDLGPFCCSWRSAAVGKLRWG